MIDPTTLEDLLAPLEKEITGNRETVIVEDVAANLATYFDELVEPRVHELVRDLSWKRRAALAGALGLVMPTPARDAVLARLLADLHREVSRQALLSYRGAVDADALTGVRALAAKGVVHAEHVRALATARDRADEATFRAAASARDDQLAIAGLTALGELPAVERASLEVIVEGLGRSDLRYPAGETLAALAASSSPEAIHRQLSGSPALAMLARLVERAEHDHQAPLRAIVAAGRASIAPGAASAPAPVPPVARELAGYGAILDGTSPDHAVRVGDEATLADLARLLTGTPRRSVVLVGPNGAGKTSVVHALARRLRDDGVVVLETSTGEILAGTKYLGEWETRLKKLIDAARAPAKVILYVTDVASLAGQGRSADRDGSFADVLAPYLDRGELAIVGEATDDALRTGVDRHPAMRRMFSRIRVRDATPAEAAAVVRGRIEAASRDGASVSAAPAVVEQIVEMASLALPGSAAPGAACRLLDRMIEVARERAASQRGGTEIVLEPSDVIGAISRATGMPTQLLDDRQPFDRAAVRAFFEERVLGQPEAIEVVVELVTLVKAGLTDPDRPYGSLFFVGPTGVGKTEIAKALAEHLFGTPDRMIRIDMSELKQWDSHERLIGSAMRPNDGMLTKRVAEQPFSVVLLDEIEKAHPNVHDLLLQVLDDGRLTDARGQTIDFRRTVVVMTSNVGSRIDVDAVGFGARAQAPSEDAVMREVRGVFRPELVNRFGRIVVFRPLSPETMRTLVRRELGKVVLRSGVLRRRLAVDLAPDLVDLLVREGFSPAYGARPLKRRVERRVLLPIAELIVSLGPDAAGTILRAAVEGDRIVVRAIAPQVEPQPVRERAGGARTIAAAGERLEELVRRSRSLAEHPRVGAAERRRAELLADTSRRTFWDDAEGARAAMTELAELDDRESARATIERRIEGAGELLRDRRAAAAARAHDVLDELERGLAMLEHRYLVEEPGDRADVIVQLTRIGSGAESAQLLTTLAGIYEAWAAKHGVRATLLDGAGEDAGSITLHLDGHGLFGLFRDEAGLHRLADAGRGSDRKRFAVRATVMACPETPLPGTAVERVTARGRTRFVVSHAASERVLEAELPDVRGRDAEIERLLGCWLRARVSGSGSARDDVVRRYGVEDRYAVDEASGVRVRTKDLATTGLDAIFDARVRARLEARREAGE